MAIVNTQVPITSQSASRMMEEIANTYPFARLTLLTTTVFQRPVYAMTMGTGPRSVFFSAAHHANEWITALVLLKFMEDLARAIADGGQIDGVDAQTLAQQVTFHFVPLVNPDGVDLVTGAVLPDTPQYQLAQRISRDYPQIPFPDGWKANLLGTDLNLNYPAKWLMARQIKFSQGFIRPAPRDYVGRFPLDQAETQAMAAYTRLLNPELVLALHTQGKEIYWQFSDIEVPGARELGQRMADASGYALAETPYNSSFAGYKDWFIQTFRRPGYTVEAGSGVNPLPLSQFDEIYTAVVPILRIAAEG